jgi:tetratricopeptide (TPR) repeat protein
MLALQQGDAAAAYAAWMDGPNTRALNVTRASVQRALILVAMHDPSSAARTLGPAAADDGLTRPRLHVGNGGGVSTAVSAIARERGDWAEALRQAELARAAVAELPPEAREPGVGPGAHDLTELAPRQAEALAELGRLSEARATITATPVDCYLCVRIRGRIAALAGQPAEADRWYADAVRQAPSLPQADLEWGYAKLARGDAAGAIVRFAAARKNGPRFADPLEGWGEALLAQGDARAAAAKFAQAARLAPRWGRARVKWGAALAKLGQTAQARAQWRLAAGLDLTPAERAELAAYFAKPAT